jgi:hypothetical protein
MGWLIVLQIDEAEYVAAATAAARASFPNALTRRNPALLVGPSSKPQSSWLFLLGAAVDIITCSADNHSDISDVGAIQAPGKVLIWVVNDDDVVGVVVGLLRNWKS